jgi:sterol desaturase/sphingolipid hydroxylase (fatty acid hydroxylase superfamily)/predicted amino acid dehydrogenase
MEKGEVIQNVYDTIKGGVLSLESTTRTYDFAFFCAWAAFIWLSRVIILKFLLFLNRTDYADTYRITKKPAINDMQLERESVWKYGYIYDTVAMMGCYYYGMFNNLPLINLYGLVLHLFWHATAVEFIYYWFHRLLHVQWFYKKYHQYHHKSINTLPTTALSFEIVERVSYTILFAIPAIATDLMGYQSLIAFALYYCWFDFMNEGGHINFEPLPQWYFSSPLRYLIYSPTFHAVHHTKFKRNYSLFMPWTDILFGTATYSGYDKNEEILPTRAPQTTDFMLLVHAAYLGSALYSVRLHPKLSVMFRLSHKYQHRFWMYLFYPYLFVISVYWTLLEKIGFHSEEDFEFTPNTNDQLKWDAPLKTNYNGSTWIIRNYGVQYLLPSFKRIIQNRIENAVLEAQRQNIRVVGLGNFNKAEWMNHGGSDIVDKLKDKLKGIYISHGDTLSAAVIYNYSMQLKYLGYWNKSVFVTGSTSKIGRAVVLSLANQQIRVVMYTQCRERFDEIAAEAGENAKFLVFSDDLRDGKTCDLWLTGKMLPKGKELINAIPPHSVVVNFAVPDPLTPKLMKSRPDLLHLDSGLLHYDHKVMNPKFTWLLPKGHIYACLAGAVVHSVLGIESHEVGPVVVSDMEKYWNAALALGFTIPPPSSFYNPITMPPPRNL